LVYFLFLLQESSGCLGEVIIMGTFLSAAVFVSPLRGVRRSIAINFCFLVALMITALGPIATITATYLPTLVHVLLFTGLFVLYGALKGDRF